MLKLNLEVVKCYEGVGSNPGSALQRCVMCERPRMIPQLWWSELEHRWYGNNLHKNINNPMHQVLFGNSLFLLLTSKGDRTAVIT